MREREKDGESEEGREGGKKGYKFGRSVSLNMEESEGEMGSRYDHVSLYTCLHV